MRTRFWIASALMLCSFVLTAEEADKAKKSPVSLTVEEAVEYAIKNSKTLKSSAIDLKIKERASNNAWNVLLPGASLSGTFTRANEYSYASEMSGKINKMMGYTLYNVETNKVLKDSVYMPMMMSKNGYSSEKDHWSIAGNLGFSWNFSAAMVESIRMAKVQYEAGEISWEQTKANTEVNIRKMFYGLLLAQENLNIQKESLENAKSRWTQSEINYKNGMIPRLSMLNAKVTYENKRPAVLSAEQSLKQSKDTFAFLLGMPYGQDIELVGGIEFSYIDVDADELYNKYVEQNYEIQSLKKNIQTLKMGINATNLSVFTPALAVSWNLTPVVIDKDSNWFDKDNTFDNGSLSITLAFKNLFDMLPCSSSMQKAKDMKQQLEQAELGLEQLYQNAENEVHKLADTLVVSKENIEAMERNVSMAQDAYEATLKAYNAGTQERLELQDSEQQLNQAKLGLMNEKFNYISALLDLETKLNIKLR